MNKLQQALDLSQEIEQAVQEYDWEKVERLDELRQQVIQQYYAGEQVIDAEMTRHLKQVNDSIIQQLADIQSQIRQQQLGIKQGQKMSRAYQKHQG